MRDSELIGLATREAERLTSENDHCAATLMRELVERLRLRQHGGVDCALLEIHVDQKQLTRMVGSWLRNYEKAFK